MKKIFVDSNVILRILTRDDENQFMKLEALLATSGLVVIDRKLVEKAISKSRKSGIEFPDAYVSVLAEEHECGEIATFNISDFKKLNAKLYPF
ncbi:MAG: hypothetical protein WCP55_15415 [Lentisphaerota bacterium]